MKNFFAIIKTEENRDYSVVFMTLDAILSAVDNEFDARTRNNCESAPSPVSAAQNFLGDKWKRVEFFTYDMAGASELLWAARGLGPVYELRAVELVQVLRNSLDRLLESSLNEVRAYCIQKRLTRADGTISAQRLEGVRHLLDASASELIALL
jgi:hypothetical protein